MRIKKKMSLFVISELDRNNKGDIFQCRLIAEFNYGATLVAILVARG